jgi:hypothetical protein
MTEFGVFTEFHCPLLALREELGLTTISAWMNAGSLIPHERIVTSMRLFAEHVIP